MEPSQLQKLRNAIRSAFPPGRFLGEATECDCDECRYIADELRDRQWDELTNDFLDFTCGPTPLLSPMAFHTFLPRGPSGSLLRAYQPSSPALLQDPCYMIRIAGDHPQIRPRRLVWLSAALLPVS